MPIKLPTRNIHAPYRRRCVTSTIDLISQNPVTQAGDVATADIERFEANADDAASAGESMGKLDMVLASARTYPIEHRCAVSLS
jgi:hypothetical protein